MLFLSAQRSHHGNYLLNLSSHVFVGRKALVLTQVTWSRPDSPLTQTTASDCIADRKVKQNWVQNAALLLICCVILGSLWAPGSYFRKQDTHHSNELLWGWTPVIPEAKNWLLFHCPSPSLSPLTVSILEVSLSLHISSTANNNACYLLSAY